jgi:alkylation response protein AidB-like acyl-CoA dehydrogenase
MTDTATDVITELKDWLNDNWDPDLTVAEWWERLGLAGWSAPGLPKNAYGRELSRADSVRVQQTIAEHGALGAPGGLGLLLAAPTIATHGTQEQIDLYVKDIVTGQKAWCQLFSEPGAGSDPRPHQRRGAQAPGHQLLRPRHAPGGRGRPPAAGDHRARHVQRGVHVGRPLP